MHFKRILVFFPFCLFTLTHAIIGGKEATTIQGQVQLWRKIDGKDQYVCTGSLISPLWVLTAKHCLKEGPIETYFIKAGSLKFGEGNDHKASRAVNHPKQDLAAIHLESPADPVIGYSVSELEACTVTNLRGWGPTQFDEEPPLMHAIMPFIGYAEHDNTKDMGLGNGGSGFPAPGDSGAGVEVDGVIYGTLKDGIEANPAFAVPFAKIDDWIKTTTGVAPAQLNSRDLVSRKDPQCGLICPGFNFGVADLGRDPGTGKEGYAVLNSMCKQVAGTITKNPCVDPLFDCSPPPIKIVGLHLNGKDYACRGDPRSGTCNGAPVQVCCRNDGK